MNALEYQKTQVLYAFHQTEGIVRGTLSDCQTVRGIVPLVLKLKETDSTAHDEMKGHGFRRRIIGYGVCNIVEFPIRYIGPIQ